LVLTLGVIFAGSLVRTSFSAELPSERPPTPCPECSACWGGIHPDEAGEKFLKGFSIPWEHDIMMRWKRIQRFPPIPKIIHQVWIGDLSRAYCSWMDSFRINFIQENPDWRYKIWTRELYESKYGPMVLGRAFDRETKVASKADILRYEVVWREGGIYMDADSIWLNNSFNFLIGMASATGFFAVLHDEIPEHLGINHYMNGVFGASKCHPAMEHIVRAMDLLHADMFYEQKMVFYKRTGPFFFSNALRGFKPAVIDRDIFAPGSWFFEIGNSTFEASIAERMSMMKSAYPDALTFQIGVNTHNREVGYSCREWAEALLPQLKAMISSDPPVSQEALECGDQDYMTRKWNP